MKKRSVVLFIHPPDSGTFLNGDLSVECSNGAENHKVAGRSDSPHLGILSLASCVQKHSSLDPVYLDGTVRPEEIGRFIANNRQDILAVCVSALTLNFGSAAQICEFVKQTDPGIMTVMGNDHFSALSEKILTSTPCLDYGFAGNEILGSLNRFLEDKSNGTLRDPSSYPGLVYRSRAGVSAVPSLKEAMNEEISYELVDKHVTHSAFYEKNFRIGFGSKYRDLFRRDIGKITPVEIARGCIKFKNQNPCSFCSIHHGGMWRNSVSPHGAWGIIEKAYESGYEMLSITADELPLTFPQLMLHMARERPKWHKVMPESKLPILFGYARADGMQKEPIVAAMREIGVRVCFIGMDAGAPLSLQAMNKTLQKSNMKVAAEKLLEDNFQATRLAEKHGIYVMLGLVLGHIGMTPQLLEENVNSTCDIISANNKAVMGIDISLLSPVPGSQDFWWLTHPCEAMNYARAHGLRLADEKTLFSIAGRYSTSVFGKPGSIERAEKDYIKAFMPELSPRALMKARLRIMRHAKQYNIGKNLNL